MRDRVAVLLSTILLGTLAGCATGSYRTEPRFLVSLETDRSAMLWGETLKMRVTVVNPRGEVLLLRFPDSCQFGFRIEDAAGNLVARDNSVCFMAPSELVLAPGEATVREMSWTWDDNDVMAGSYRVLAGLGKAAQVGAAEAKLLLRSRPIPIEDL